jgi:hypothetical protein
LTQTFFETKLQYLDLNQEIAEFLAPLFSFQHLVLILYWKKCELRDVIFTLPWFIIKACCFTPEKNLMLRKNGGFSYLHKATPNPTMKLTNFPSPFHSRKTVLVGKSVCSLWSENYLL